jgi:Helix-turn-helix domain
VTVISQQGKLEQQPEWMDLKAVQRYACVCERTVRDWIHRPQNPLPAVQVEKGKLLIKRSQFDRWLGAHPYISADVIDVGQIVNDVMKELRVN